MGADPAQYAAVAKHYIPILLPDRCILVFDELGDIMYFKRDPQPFVPLAYTTNAGQMRAWKSQWSGVDNDHFNSVEEAYEFFIDMYTLKGESTSLIGKILGTTAMGTLAYKYFSNWIDPVTLYKDPTRYMVTRKYLEEIDSMCNLYNVYLSVVFLPARPEPDRTDEMIREEFAGLFDDFTTYKPIMVRSEDYGADSVHLNNLGHQKMADYILENILDE